MEKYSIKLGDIEIDCEYSSSIELTKESDNFKYLIHHDNSKPIGETLEVLNIDNGIIVTFEFNLSEEEIEPLINFYKKEGMFISRDGNTIKYKISVND